MPGWDIAFPQQPAAVPGFRAMVARPFLPRYFSGYDLYVWLDADCWVQDRSVLDLYLDEAAAVGAALTPELHRAYQANYNSGYTRDWIHRCYREAFGQAVADQYVNYPLINSGVFAMRTDSPIWPAWQQALRTALQLSTDYHVEQTALNFAIYRLAAERGPLPFAALPARCNWHCANALPRLDLPSGLLTDPLAPHEPIGVVHLCGLDQREQPRILLDSAGEPRETVLLYARGRY
jgi:hypothetical protein